MTNKFPHALDLRLILPVLVLLFISLTTLFSVNPVFFKSQLIFTFVSVVFFFTFSQLNFESFRSFTLPLYIGSLILLLFVLFLGIESRGAVRWLDIFGFRIQFSEILKPFLALCLASFLANRNNTSGKTLLAVLAGLLPVAFFIYKQPDLGNALIYAGTAVLTLIAYGFSFRYFLVGLIALAIAVPLNWSFLHQYQRERLLSFFHITNDPLGISYNAIQSVIAVGSGNFFGKGLGQGTQSTLRFLPERHTDFIFATVSEELGFLGAVIVIIAFLFLFRRLLTLFRESDDLFAKMFLAATFSLFILQFFINIGMNIGIVPIVGVTLPFMSYGGSSLLSNAIFLGIVSSILRKPKNKSVLEIT